MGAVNVTPQIVIARSIDEVAGRTDLSGYAQSELDRSRRV